MEQDAKKKYAASLRHGPPRHAACDEFTLRHPKMPLGQRAKIFSPFAALRGFEEAIDEKTVTYVEKRELSDADQERLNRKLSELYALVPNRRAAREHPVTAAVLYYLPCPDENHEAYGLRGSYEKVTGRVWTVDPVLSNSLVIGEETIAFSDIAELTIVNPEEEE